jgi:hypothetical protein
MVSIIYWGEPFPTVSLATGSIDMPMLSHEGKSERAIDGNTAAAHVAYALSHPAASPASPVWKFGSWVLDDVSCGKVDNKSSFKITKRNGWDSNHLQSW